MNNLTFYHLEGEFFMQPLIDIHLHLDGSLPYSTVKKLIQVHGILTMTDTQLRSHLSVSNDCHDLNEYLEKFAFPLTLMQTQDDLELIDFDLLKELKQQGLVYAEIRFAPQLHTQKGLTQTEVVQAVIDGRDKFLNWQVKDNSNAPLHVNFLLCCMRMKGNHQENEETVEVAKQFLNKGAVGIDLAGAETPQFAIHKYKDLFDKASSYHIPYTIHAGEAMGPESMKEALALKTTRIGHGIRCSEDEELVKTIVKDKITLECCATSNLNTKVFDKLDDYPIKKLLSEDVKVTLNSDNMTVSNTNLPFEYQQLEEKTNLTKQDEEQLYLNAVRAAFCSEEEKARLRSLI